MHGAFPAHLEVSAIQVICLSLSWSPVVREELVSAPIRGKMPILHRVSEQPQSINQQASEEKDIMYLCVGWCVCVCWLGSSRQKLI